MVQSSNTLKFVLSSWKRVVLFFFFFDLFRNRYLQLRDSFDVFRAFPQYRWKWFLSVFITHHRTDSAKLITRQNCRGRHPKYNFPLNATPTPLKSPLYWVPGCQLNAQVQHIQHQWDLMSRVSNMLAQCFFATIIFIAMVVAPGYTYARNSFAYALFNRHLRQ